MQFIVRIVATSSVGVHAAAKTPILNSGPFALSDVTTSCCSYISEK